MSEASFPHMPASLTAAPGARRREPSALAERPHRSSSRGRVGSLVLSAPRPNLSTHSRKFPRSRPTPT